MPRSSRSSAGVTVVLFRSGRHVRVAIDALRGRFPGARVVVVGQPASEASLVEAGVAPDDRIIYQGGFFGPWRFYVSAAGRAVRRLRGSRIAMLWYNPDGIGMTNVIHTALVLSPRGYLAITPDGSVIDRSPLAIAGTEAVRALLSAGTLAAMAVLLYGPAAVARLLKGGPRGR